MERSLQWRGLNIPVIDLIAAVVGSGAAGFAAACRLDGLGVRDVAIVTEGLNSGTSRNTGSDKQTYYKLSLCGGEPDSVDEMAATFFAGGSMDGDIALIEAAASAGNFLRLVSLGVPFPHNEYGEYAGYKTDHDPKARATSAGPLTSKYMTEALERDALRRGIRILDNHVVIGILTDKQQANQCLGLLALDTAHLNDPARGLTLIRAANVIWAVGGEACMFDSSVYPLGQHGALGVALEAGAGAANLAEWQHGLASVAFRWNVSGTYQQALPRYVSTDADGNDEREFLMETMTSEDVLNMTFLKGYQWPFDARKLPGSSVIDILVYIETAVKGRRVWLDYRSNPNGFENGFGNVSQECKTYLEKSGALHGTPFDRLMKMNPGAAGLYRAHGIDLAAEMLEVAVCAQHMNGGLAVDRWWRTDIEGLYACGEAAGTFGAYRPGGGALNSTQTGALRAAQHIAANRRDAKPDFITFTDLAAALLDEKGAWALDATFTQADTVSPLLQNARRRMSRCGAHLRDPNQIKAALSKCEVDIAGYWHNLSIPSLALLPDAFRGYDMLLSQYACLSSMLAYVEAGGPSRGSALILDEDGQTLPGVPWKCRAYSDAMDGQVLQTWLDIKDGKPECRTAFRPVRPVPERDLWFENVWREYREGNVDR